MISELVLRLWPVALMAAPLALIAHLLCRVLPMRPSTRHSLFLGVLVFLLVAPLLPAPPAFDVSELLASAPKSVAPITAAPADHPVLSRDSNAIGTAPLLETEPGTAQPLMIESKHEAALPKRLTWFWPMGPWQPPIPIPVRPDDSPFFGTQPTAESALAQTIAPNTAPAIAPAHQTNPATIEVADAAPLAMARARDRYASAKRQSPASSARRPAPRPAIAVDPEPCDDTEPVSAVVTAMTPPPAALTTATLTAPAATSSPTIAWESVRRASIDLATAVSQLPPLPPLIWSVGSLLVVLVIGFRFLQFTLLLRRAVPAPEDVTRRVAEAARELGVRRVPVTVMTDARVSPMVALAPRRLLLPVGLWGQLDEVGQRAVLYHELAHLARRDHWVCWLDLMVSIIYWWHPVAWWMRRRLCEEADLSCDAWVINLLPRSRRAYATALLESRVYTTTRTVGPGLPSMALGASHIRKRRFARRLTMVMTKDSTPRRTLTGIALAGSVITLGWLVSPAFACPPDQQDDAPKRRVITITSGDSSDECTTQKDTDCTSDEDATSTFERFMRGRDDVSMNDKLEMLEAHLETMTMRLADWAENIEPEQLAELEAHLSQLKNVDLDSLRGHLAQLQHADLSELAELAELAEIAEFEGLDQLAEYVDLSQLAELAENIDFSELSELAEYVNLDELKGRLIALGDLGDGPVVLGRSGGIGVGGGPVLYGDNRISRVYYLPEGKLEAITNLMKLDNVPILISPRDDGIELHATQSQHMIFNAFVTMINAEDLEERYSLEGSKLSALTELMTRKDVPVMVVPGDDSIGVQGDSLQQLIFGAFVKMISPEPGPDFNMSPPDGDRADQRSITVGSGAGGGYTIGRAETRAKKYEARARQEVKRIQAMERHHAELIGHYERLAVRAETMERHAEELYQEIERLEEMAEVIEEEADGLDARARIKLIHKYNKIVSQAQALRNEARVVEIEAEVHAAEMEEIEERAASLEDEMVDLADELEELADALEDDDDDDLLDEI